MALRTRHPSEYRQCCIRHNFFTAGGNDAYSKAFSLIEQGITLNDLALITWICSSRWTLEEIKEILKKELHWY